MADLHNTILVSTGIVAALPLIATGHFLWFGWPARKAQILSRFSNDSIKHYRDTFCPEATFVNTAEFEKDYEKRYGRRLFFFPVLLFAITVIFLAYFSTSWVWSHDWWGATEGTGKIAISSLAGAYIWVTYDLVFRVRQNDVVTSDINRATLRLLLSLPFGFAIAAFAGEVPGMTGTRATSALAFFVGSFPTDTVLKFMRRTAFLWLKLDANAEDDSLKQLMKIDGITTPVAERFIDEGIRSNLQLAYADPISLTIRTGMDFAFILSRCGHAMVRTYFNDEQMKVVDKYGLLTGLEMITLNKALLSYDKSSMRRHRERRRNRAKPSRRERSSNWRILPPRCRWMRHPHVSSSTRSPKIPMSRSPVGCGRTRKPARLPRRQPTNRRMTSAYSRSKALPDEEAVRSPSPRRWRRRGCRA